jgi:hypothetical protein
MFDSDAELVDLSEQLLVDGQILFDECADAVEELV